MFDQDKLGDFAPGTFIEKIIERVIETEEEFIFRTVRPYCESVAEMRITKDDLKRAVILLRNQESRVLTLDEVLSMGDRLMWLEYKAAVPGGSILAPTSPFDDNVPGFFSVSFQSGHVQARGLYGKQWRCWTEKPTQQQMENERWWNGCDTV